MVSNTTYLLTHRQSHHQLLGLMAYLEKKTHPLLFSTEQLEALQTYRQGMLQVEVDLSRLRSC